MKLSRIAFLVLFVPVLSLAQQATNETSGPSIVERINKPEPGKGSVHVIQSPEIAERIGRGNGKSSTSSGENESGRIIQTSGYRIQVFAGNNQRISKNEAYRKEASIKSVLPEVSTYVQFNAPFWRLKVGDFQSFQDAQKFLSVLRARFPEFGKEMSVVRDNVRIKVH